jgi:hypothetical protein
MFQKINNNNNKLKIILYIYILFFKRKKLICEGKIHNLLEHSGTFLFGMEYSNLFIYLFISLFIYLFIYVFEEARVVEPTWWNNKDKRAGRPVGEPGRARLKCQNSGLQLWLFPLAIINHGMEIARFFYIETLFSFFPLLLLMIENSQKIFIF